MMISFLEALNLMAEGKKVRKNTWYSDNYMELKGGNFSMKNGSPVNLTKNLINWPHWVEVDPKPTKEQMIDYIVDRLQDWELRRDSKILREPLDHYDIEREYLAIKQSYRA